MPDHLDQIVALSREAGLAAMEFYGDDLVVRTKSDESPVTAADLRSHEVIMARLREVSEIPIVSEESVDSQVNASQEEFWLIDPLDGTKEFIKKTGEFTVNVALIRRGRPIVGVVYAPAIDTTWFASVEGGAFVRTSEGDRSIAPIPSARPLRVAVSRDHLRDDDEGFLARLGDVERIPMGSSLKFCRVAAGEADVYVRHGRTMEWDTAAAQCVVECAGGQVVDLVGKPLRYGKPGLDNPGFVCFGDSALESRLIG